MAKIIVYLDQLHWIEIARAINGRSVKPETINILSDIMKLNQEGLTIFPLSFSHYLETLKHSDPSRRERLTKVMQQISCGKTVAAQEDIVKYEIQMALKHFFPEQIIPDNFSYLGDGLEHVLGKPLPFKLDWPDFDTVPKEIRRKIENDIFCSIENFFLSGVMRCDDGEFYFPKQDLSSDNKFKQELERWRGMALKVSQNELEREIYSATFKDIQEPILKELSKFNISVENFFKIGELGICKLLDLMPTRKVDMHLRQQWAKNINLLPKQSDLNDWSYIGSAVCYSDIVITENQMSDLLSRSINLKAKVSSNLSDLVKLVNGYRNHYADFRR